MHMVSTVFDTLKTWFGYSKSLWAYARSILGYKLYRPIPSPGLHPYYERIVNDALSPVRANNSYQSKSRAQSLFQNETTKQNNVSAEKSVC